MSRKTLDIHFCAQEQPLDVSFLIFEFSHRAFEKNIERNLISWTVYCYSKEALETVSYASISGALLYCASHHNGS